MTESGRRPAETEVTLAQLMLPDDANPSGDVHGGVVMKLVDTAAGLAAMRHARSRAVTVAMDSMTFEAPVHIGDLLHLTARLTWTGRTSMEIEVAVDAEHVLAGERRRTSVAYLVYVALDEEGHPKPVPALLPETTEERARWTAAERRRTLRLGMEPPATGDLTLPPARRAELAPKMQTLLDDLRMLVDFDDPAIEPAMSPAWGTDDDERR